MREDDTRHGLMNRGDLDDKCRGRSVWVWGRHQIQDMDRTLVEYHAACLVVGMVAVCLMVWLYAA